MTSAITNLADVGFVQVPEEVKVHTSAALMPPVIAPEGILVSDAPEPLKVPAVIVPGIFAPPAEMQLVAHTTPPVTVPGTLAFPAVNVPVTHPVADVTMPETLTLPVFKEPVMHPVAAFNDPVIQPLVEVTTPALTFLLSSITMHPLTLIAIFVYARQFLLFRLFKFLYFI
jgi:hypothetical protein